MSGEKTMQAKNKNNKPASEYADLDRRYGEIGISAVAAAVRYQGAVKEPAAQSVASSSRQEHEDVAA
jgi:hypothetical protein